MFFFIKFAFSDLYTVVFLDFLTFLCEFKRLVLMSLLYRDVSLDALFPMLARIFNQLAWQDNFLCLRLLFYN